ncbi:protein of unknown function [Desulfonispora thiosulfatigenes DSM 11270]|uniref:DUF5058 domain-containing protein n=1 Tax=Desulfonispora thiosulfatigenes DSM 11270 TaxID=656914 RepID=A0A1W1VAP5_DESTI|nr:DUF5058 family protein [Desulfonispora thiosulfatigenes]SMB90547.1 protein of unknown function [Desulfonispora thiosulfatigenes DSM 11270]
MELQSIINSPGLWIASSFMVIIIFGIALIYFRLALKQAEKLGISKELNRSAIRSAAITSIGPSFSSVIVLLSLIAVIGAPTAWMRLNDVGAARTELSMVSIASGLLGIDPSSADFGVQAFSYSIWAMALNNLGWFVVALVLTSRMGRAVNKLNQTYDPKWISLLMLGATFGVTGFLLSNQIISKLLLVDVPFLQRMGGLLPAIVSACVMLIISRVFKKQKRLQELSLGIAMLVGILVAQGVIG